jgi:hypothetical protein
MFYNPFKVSFNLVERNKYERQVFAKLFKEDGY